MDLTLMVPTWNRRASTWMSAPRVTFTSHLPLLQAFSAPRLVGGDAGVGDAVAVTGA
ncbi:hypothetical protein GCM10029978_078230 [Actinoallomurus acanthiterrae]